MKCLLTALALLLPVPCIAESKVIHIYQDADLSHHTESSEAIQMGMELAFDEIGNEIDGYRFEFIYLDHRGNVIRSKRNYKEFIDDPKALAIYSGIHSPPLIKNREFINQEKALTLVPWAAGGPITRHPSSENWIYRLSVDDTQAGPVIIDFALKNQGCANPHLLLEQTPWGDSNLKSMSKALRENNINNPGVTRFSWNLKGQATRAILRDIVNRGSDCIVLVANSGEGVSIISELLKMTGEEQMPVISHWGITGGNFPDLIPPKSRESLNLHFIQTCFAFTNAKQSDLALGVFSRLKDHSNGAIENPADLKPAVGFIHAYDLTKILIQAIRQTSLSGDMASDRNAIRLALENIREPVDGLVRTYHTPFSAFNIDTNPNAHEALGTNDYCMGKYGPDNEIKLLLDE